jgi:hypothetical protein
MVFFINRIVDIQQNVDGQRQLQLELAATYECCALWHTHNYYSDFDKAI